jgi:hypothetical protein
MLSAKVPGSDSDGSWFILLSFLSSCPCKLHLLGECHPCYVNKMVSHKVLFLPNSNLLRKNPSTSMLKKEATNNKALVRVPGIITLQTQDVITLGKADKLPNLVSWNSHVTNLQYSVAIQTYKDVTRKSFKRVTQHITSLATKTVYLGMISESWDLLPEPLKNLANVCISTVCIIKPVMHGFLLTCGII